MVQNHTRRRALTLIGTAGGIALAGCMGGDGDDGTEMSDDGSGDGTSDDGMNDDSETDDETGNEGANVRVAHLARRAERRRLRGRRRRSRGRSLPRGERDYLELEPGTYEVMITAAGDADTVVFDEELEIAEGAFTVAALGELSEENQPFAPAVLEDDVSDPGDTARVRLVHASPDAPAVDVTVGDGETVLFEGAEFGDAATTEVPGGEYTLEVRPATENNDGDVVATFNVAPEAGNVYTAFAVGYLEPESAPADAPFDLEVVMDN